MKDQKYATTEIRDPQIICMGVCLGGPGGGSVCGAGGSGVNSKGNKILFLFGWMPELFVSRALSSLGLSGQGWRIWQAHGVGWGYLSFLLIFPLCDTLSYFDMLHNFTYEMQNCRFLRVFKFIQTHSITFQDRGGGSLLD